MRFKKVVRWAGAVLGFYLLSTLALFVFFTTQDAPYKAKFDALRTNGYLATGTITSFEPHGGVCYSYVVEGQQYQACSGDHYPGEDQARQAVGSQLPVVFDGGDPAVSCSCDPEGEYEVRTAPTELLKALVFAPGVTLLAYLAVQWWRRPASVETGGALETETRQPL